MVALSPLFFDVCVIRAGGSNVFFGGALIPWIHPLSFPLHAGRRARPEPPATFQKEAVESCAPSLRLFENKGDSRMP